MTSNIEEVSIYNDIIIVTDSFLFCHKQTIEKFYKVIKEVVITPY